MDRRALPLPFYLSFGALALILLFERVIGDTGRIGVGMTIVALVVIVVTAAPVAWRSFQQAGRDE